MEERISRLMIAAPKSGSGKTLLTCALLGALKKKKKGVIAFKCGPDYIDPMFHRRVQEVPAENLDTWFLGEEGTRSLFVELAKEHEIAVMEGVMGLYDGLGGIREEGSAYHLAKVTKTPIILVVDVHGMGMSMVPMIKGFLDFDKEGLIQGVILNRISESFYETMKPAVEEYTRVPVVGYFPDRKGLNLESRHLGLKLPEEVDDIKEKLEMAAETLEHSVDLETLLEIAEGADKLMVSGEAYQPSEEWQASQGAYSHVPAPVLAVARDEAFCFYYEANLRLIRKLGAKILYFSPLHDAHLPKHVQGILLGGGYPELYAKELSENRSMREDIYEAIRSGVPSLAECGGFMYLHEHLIDPEGMSYAMCGVIPGDAFYKGKLVRFGYVEITSKEKQEISAQEQQSVPAQEQQSLSAQDQKEGKEQSRTLLKHGEVIKAHEFHYYGSTLNGDGCVATKPVGGKSWSCIHAGPDHFWGFPHLYYPSNLTFAEEFVKKMKKRQLFQCLDNCEPRPKIKRQGIIMLSFGTTYEDTRKKNIHALTKLVEESHPECLVMEAFSSPRVLKVLRERDDLVIFSLEEAMFEMKRRGVRELIVMPTHILGGYEYEKCLAFVTKREGWFEKVRFGEPLLCKEEDYEKAAGAFLAGFGKSDAPLILMGHGTSHEADESYLKLEHAFAKAALLDGKKQRVLVTTVEGTLNMERVIGHLKEAEQGAEAHTKLYVTPFMLVAGDHANNDMAGEEDSVASRLKAQGYEPECILKGIGEYPAIQELYLEKLENLIRSMTE